MFSAAYYLGWCLPARGLHAHLTDANAPRALAAAHFAEELQAVADIGVRLATTQALSIQAEQDAEVRRAQPCAPQIVGCLSASSVKDLPDELRLLTTLRWLETASVDALLKQLVGGVLSHSLPAIGAKKNPGRWRKVPILVLGADDDKLQRFVIQLRSKPDGEVLFLQNLQSIRSFAQKSPSRYLALVVDSLVLAAFGEWAASASMAKRAVERAEYFSPQSETRKRFDQLSWQKYGGREEINKDTHDVDGREARYLCAHALRYSARTMSDFEEAARHLRVFNSLTQSDVSKISSNLTGVRGASESLALSLAEWSYLKYVKRQINIGLLKSLRQRLVQSYHGLDKERQLSVDQKDQVESAVFQYVWEQSALNLAIVFIELHLHHEEVESGLVPASSLAKSLGAWAFGRDEHVSAFSKFISTIACLVFAPYLVEKISGSSREMLVVRVTEYAKSVPPDGVIYERGRAYAYRELVEFDSSAFTTA